MILYYELLAFVYNFQNTNMSNKIVILITISQYIGCHIKYTLCNVHTFYSFPSSTKSISNASIYPCKIVPKFYSISAISYKMTTTRTNKKCNKRRRPTKCKRKDLQNLYVDVVVVVGWILFISAVSR